jgi:flagellum-specific peptidoglycan hydrolase FlgJ
MRKIYALLFLLLIGLSSCHHSRKLRRQREVEHAARANNNVKRFTTSEYIAMYEGIAVHNMHKYGIPASIILAQGILESNSGNSELARYANNHFGIKCTGDWTGKTMLHDDDKRNECFRKYANAEASYADHVAFLQRPRYAALFDLRTRDYKRWARGLKKAGYATNPRYPELLIDLIEKYDLEKYDSYKK